MAALQSHWKIQSLAFRWLADCDGSLRRPHQHPGSRRAQGPHSQRVPVSEGKAGRRASLGHLWMRQRLLLLLRCPPPLQPLRLGHPHGGAERSSCQPISCLSVGSCRGRHWHSECTGSDGGGILVPIVGMPLFLLVRRAVFRSASVTHTALQPGWLLPQLSLDVFLDSVSATAWPCLLPPSQPHPHGPLIPCLFPLPRLCCH